MKGKFTRNSCEAVLNAYSLGEETIASYQKRIREQFCTEPDSDIRDMVAKELANEKLPNSELRGLTAKDRRC